MENIFHVENWDSMSDEDKQKTNELLKQHETFVRKQVEKENAEKLEQEKLTMKEQLEKEQEAKATKDKYLSQVPEKNKAVISRLLDAGETPDSISANYSQLLEQEPETIPGNVLADQINGKHNDANTTPSGSVSSERDAEIKRIKEQGVDPHDKELNARVEEYRKQGLL